ncbi:MAG: xanthine dehydrogenase family protein molybdopterin-binding subunit [Alphaproteobacteria bacterium]|nr:xanthine dehydrogenase family protein molybdopterin-binding subunit [Alphaproteobacteria bacterium]
MESKLTGAAIRRREDFNFLTGRGRYTDDSTVPGQLFAGFVRSPHPHARIHRIDSAVARATAGVIAVFTGADLVATGVTTPPRIVTLIDKDGRPMIVPPRRPLAVDAVKYAGEPVAIVIGIDRDAAKSGVDAVEVDYDPLPAVTATEAAPDQTSPPVWPEATLNSCAIVAFGDKAMTDAAFARAARVVHLSLVNNRVASNALETRAGLAVPEADGRIVLHTTAQSPHIFQDLVATALGWPTRKVRVVATDVGGGFGTKGVPYGEEIALTWAAARLGMPIRWTCERSEAFVSDAHGRDQVNSIELALDSTGHFTGLRIATIGTVGAYASGFGLVPSGAQSTLATGPYLIASVYGEFNVTFSNTVPLEAYRGAGRPETTYMLERVIDRAALETGVDPAALRRRNLIPPDRMPYRTPLNRTYDSGDFPAVLDQALTGVDYAGFPIRRAEARARGKRRGIGIAYYIEQGAWGPSRMALAAGRRYGSYESAAIKVDAEGAVTATTGTHSHGQGLDTVFAQLIGDWLGVPMEKIEVKHGDTDMIGFGMGSIGSRSLVSGGAALKVAIDKVIAKTKKIAAHLLEVAVADIQFKEGAFTVAGTDRRVTFAEIARAAYLPLRYPIEEIEPGLEETGYWDPTSQAFPNGCHVCEVEVDEQTGAVTLVRLVAVDDFGNVINPLIVDGQVHGGMAQGAGQALMEQIVYDRDSGQLVTGSFMDYAIPRAEDLPTFELASSPHPCQTNPLGVKGCGEAGAIGAPPAIMNAIIDALADLGVRHIDMPATPARVWQAIEDAKRRS